MNGNGNIYITSCASSKKNIREAVEELVKIGFRDIELSAGTRNYPGIENDLLDLKRKSGVNFLVHNYFPPEESNLVLNIASRDTALRDKTFAFIKKAVSLAQRLGSDLYTLHPGFSKDSVLERNGDFCEDELGLQGEENTRDDFYRGIDFISENVAKNNFRVAIENFFPFKGRYHSFLNTDEDIIHFLNRYKETANIGFLLDLAHLDIASRRSDFDKFKAIEKILGNFADKVFEIHVSETKDNNDAHEVSPVDSWQVRLLKQTMPLKQAPVTFEWRNSEVSRFYERYLELREALAFR